MNKVILMGRLVQEPDLKYSSKDSSMAIVRFTLAVDRRFAKKDDANKTDFVNCVAFSKIAEFASKYFHKGQRALVEGRIQTGNYTNKEGQKVYTTDIAVENMEFADSLKQGQGATAPKESGSASVMDGFTSIDGSTDDSELPFE